MQILPKAATHPTKYGKAKSKKVKLEINDAEKKNVEKKKEKSIKIDNQTNYSDTSVIEDNSVINERDVDFEKDNVNLKDKFAKEREYSNTIARKNQRLTKNAKEMSRKEAATL